MYGRDRRSYSNVCINGTSSSTVIGSHNPAVKSEVFCISGGRHNTRLKECACTYCRRRYSSSARAYADINSVERYLFDLKVKMETSLDKLIEAREIAEGRCAFLLHDGS